MSLAIDIDRVTQVLLRGYPEWLSVLQVDGKSTFVVDAYELAWRDGDEYWNLADHHASPSSLGFSWLSPDGDYTACSASDVLAFSYKRASK